MRSRAKAIAIDREHESIYKRISELTKLMRQMLRVLEDDENLSITSKKRLEDLSREVY